MEKLFDIERKINPEFNAPHRKTKEYPQETKKE